MAIRPVHLGPGGVVRRSRDRARRGYRIRFALANPDNLPASLTPIPVEEEVENLRQALGDLRRRGEAQVTIPSGRSGLTGHGPARSEADPSQSLRMMSRR